MDNKKTKLTEKEALHIADVSGSVLHLTPSPISIVITSPITGDKLGEFKEVEGKLTFNGVVEEAGLVFVDFVCETFNSRIKHLHSR